MVRGHDALERGLDDGSGCGRNDIEREVIPLDAGVEALDEALDVPLQPHLLARLDQMRAADAPKLRIMTKEIRELGPLRSEEHTSELQSRQYLVCRLLLEKKNTARHGALDIAGHGQCAHVW